MKNCKNCYWCQISLSTHHMWKCKLYPKKRFNLAWLHGWFCKDRRKLDKRMTKEEAINTLEHNHPSICYEDLCKAVELQIPNEWETEKFDPSYFSYTEPKMVYVCIDCKGITDNAYKYCPHCGKAKIKKEIKDL